MIDAHVHIWDDHRLATFDWITDEMDAIRRQFDLAELLPSLDAHGVRRVVLVQTSSSLDETRGFLKLAATEEIFAGVVGWVDLADAGLGETLAELRELPGGNHLVGIRHQVHDESDAHWLLREDVRRGLRAVEEAGLVYDLLVRTRELPAALELARGAPGLRLVIDHLGKPPVASAELEPWASQIAPFAELDHVSCKVSGLVTEATWDSWSPSDLTPYVAKACEWFGEDRLMFGSDWPLCLLAASYGEVVDACEESLGDLSASVRAKIFEENAKKVYGLT